MTDTSAPVLRMSRSIDVPDSRLCASATALAREAYEPFLLNHSLRSFAFADAVGRASRQTYDRELLYVACLLHDLGLACTAPVETRFEIEGADAAVAFLASHGVSDRERELVWDAIALHTTVDIPQRKRAEIALCQTGTAIDVGFAPASLVPHDEFDSIQRAYPRLGFKHAMVGALCGLLRRNRSAAARSPAVAAVGERLIEGFEVLHICDVIANASFDE